MFASALYETACWQGQISELTGRWTAVAGPFSSQPFGPEPVGPFFCVALSARTIQIWALVRALKNSQLTSGKIYVISGTEH